jgi:hypothetical protein
MPVGVGKTRINLTIPEKLLQDVQHEADASNRTISEVIVATVEQIWQSADQERVELRQLVSQLAGHLETELATIHHILSRVVALLEAMQPQQKVELSEPEPRIATYEEIYADDPTFNPPKAPLPTGAGEKTPEPQPMGRRWWQRRT